MAGLSRGDRCVYILDHSSEDDVLDAVMRVRDVQSRVDDDDIIFLSGQESYLKDGCFDADRMLRFVRDCEERARADGYAGLTATGEMSWQTKGAPGSDQLMAYEARLNDLCRESRLALLCQYEEPVFDHVTLIDVLRTHPRVVLKGEPCINPHYRPPDEFLSTMKGVVPRATYERTCQDVLRRARFSMIHRMEMRDFRKTRRSLSALETFGLGDISSIVEIVSFYNDLARDSCDDPDILAHLDVIASGCGDAQKRIGLLRLYRSISESEPEWRELDEILDSVCSEIDCCIAVRDCEMEGVEILADSLFGTAALALIENLPGLNNDADEVRVGTHRAEDDLVVSIEHVDCGVPDLIKNLLFGFDYRHGHSDGFGLFLAAEILSSLGMSVRENGVPGRSTRFEIRVPPGRYRAAGKRPESPQA